VIYRLIAAAIAGAIAVFAFYAFMKPESPPPSAEDQLVQNVDLTRIESFSPIGSQTLDIRDQAGRHYRMAFTRPCPGLEEAKSFSLATEDFRDLDRFTGIVLNGRLCTFKDFSPAKQ